MSWITESNRHKHYVYGALIAFFFTILATLGAAFALEYKDKCYGGKFDWLDILATILGGIVGQTLQVLIIIALYNL